MAEILTMRLGPPAPQPHAVPLALPVDREVLCDRDLGDHDEAHPEASLTRSLRNFLFQDQTTRLRQTLDVSWITRRRPKPRRSA